MLFNWNQEKKDKNKNWTHKLNDDFFVIDVSN